MNIFLILLLLSFSAFSQEKTIPHCNDNLFNLEWWHYEFKKINFIYIPSQEFKKEIVVAVIDTGINYDNKVVKSAIPSKYNVKDFDFSEGVNSHTNHGSHIVGTILGINPKVKILPLNYVGVNETMDEKGHKKAVRSLARAINYAVSQKVDIINISMGHEEAMSEESQALEYARQKGILVVVSAGNNALDIDMEKFKMYPASYKYSNMIVVGLKQKDRDKDANMSNTGFKTVDVFSDGMDIKSLSKNNCEIETESGTSMATALMTGYISLVKAREDVTNDDIRSRIKESSRQVEKMRSQYGFFDYLKFLGLKK